MSDDFVGDKDSDLVSFTTRTVKVLSGIVMGGGVAELPLPPDSPPGTVAKKVLQSYRPTQNAWEFPLKKDPTKSPATFNDEEFLGQAGDQYTKLIPSMFSGLMASAVQLMLGAGVKIPYDYKWDKCNGICYGSDGKPWLIEISSTRGVWAMPMKIKRVSPSIGMQQPVLGEAYALFGGVPDPSDYPATDDALTGMIADGKALQLLYSSGVTEFFSKSNHSPTMGWSFAPDGSSAHNTCWEYVSDQENKGYHYSLDFSFGALPSGSNAASAGGSATLSKRAEGIFARRSADYTPYAFYSHVSNSLRAFSRPSRGKSFTSVTEDVKAPLFACHINGELRVLWAVTPVNPYNPSTGGGLYDVYVEGGAICAPTYEGVASIHAKNKSVKPHVLDSAVTPFEGYESESTHAFSPGVDEVSVTFATQSGAGFATHDGYPYAGYLRLHKRFHGYWLEDVNEVYNFPPSFMWPRGARDAYLLYVPKHNNDVQGTSLRRASGGADSSLKGVGEVSARVYTGTSGVGHEWTCTATLGEIVLETLGSGVCRPYAFEDVPSVPSSITVSAVQADLLQDMVSTLNSAMSLALKAVSDAILLSPTNQAIIDAIEAGSLFADQPEYYDDPTYLPQVATIYMVLPLGDPVKITGFVDPAFGTLDLLDPRRKTTSPHVYHSHLGPELQVWHSYHPDYFNFFSPLGSLVEDIGVGSFHLNFIGYTS